MRNISGFGEPHLHNSPVTALIQSHNLLNDLIIYSSHAFSYIQCINQQNALSKIKKNLTTQGM